jgi:predicted ATP-grasp superfamily ATP-dependent carboligase
MPDSKAAAKAVEALDKYLNLNIDYKPLLKQAEKFEDKLKHILEQKEQTVSEQEKKKLSYIS